MFYGLDLGKLQRLHGSNDEQFAAELLRTRTNDLQSNDEFFADMHDEDAGEEPLKSETALREILAGKANRSGAAAMYGYVLKIMCEHLGQSIGEDVAAVRDHPYRSQLVSSGPPIPMTYDGADFPEIGYLALADIPAEIQRIDAAPRKARKSLVLSLFSLFSGGMVGRQMSDDDVAEDMAAYRATLQEALDKKLSIVSFRH
jgi:hypothetical protein